MTHAPLRPEPDPVTRRLGVIASSAAVGNAVQRNKAKRRLRAIFRNHQEIVPAGCDLILSARNSMNRTAFSEIEQKFVAACREIAPR